MNFQHMNFETALQIGKTGESEIAKYFKQKNFHVLPVYEKTDRDFKGPQLFCADGTCLIAPDMLVMKKNNIFWIEAKHKSAFTWNRKYKKWQTGIDLHHFKQYLKVQKETEFPVWILFLHQSGVAAKDTPEGMISPSGLFGQDIKRLEKFYSHTHTNWGKSGMIYWNHEHLICLELPECI